MDRFNKNFYQKNYFIREKILYIYYTYINRLFFIFFLILYK